MNKRALWLVIVLASLPLGAFAKTVKATILCGVIKNGQVEVLVPTPDDRKLSEVSCSVHLDQDAALNVMVVVNRPSGSGPSHKGEISRKGNEAQDFEVQLVAGEPGRDEDFDFVSCEKFTISAQIGDDDGVYWNEDVEVTQTCDSDAPAGPAWSEGALESLPDEAARKAAKTWAAAIEGNDYDFLRANFPKAGVAVQGKKKVTKKSFLKSEAGFGDLFLVVPLGPCQDEASRSFCSWGKWSVLLKGKKQFWVYTESESGYGQFPALVFKKSGKKWTWGAVKIYDTGEP